MNKTIEDSRHIICTGVEQHEVLDILKEQKVQWSKQHSSIGNINTFFEDSRLRTVAIYDRITERLVIVKEER